MLPKFKIVLYFNDIFSDDLISVQYIFTERIKISSIPEKKGFQKPARVKNSCAFSKK